MQHLQRLVTGRTRRRKERKERKEIPEEVEVSSAETLQREGFTYIHIHHTHITLLEAGSSFS